ncbi:MAG: cytochrome c [Puia sp.]
MKNITLRNATSLLILAIGLTSLSTLNGCQASQKVSAKTGVQLWTENCQRCHNTPSASSFSSEQWETIGLHMQSRALLTDQERDKIVAFMKQ